MKKVGFLILIFVFLSCNNNPKIKTSQKQVDSPVTTETSTDKEEIQKLIRQVLIWSDSTHLNLLPVLADSIDSLYIGFDMNELKSNLNMLKETNLFAIEFIDNYNKIILTLDSNLKNKEYGDWLVDDLPVFNFANDVNPWCLCQDNLPWENVVVQIISLSGDKGELSWKWGNLSANSDSSWSNFSYNFTVVKEDGRWKIAYLQGFDFKESTK